MPDDEKVAAVRAALPAVEAGIYLNTGDAGPLPAETAAAMAELEGWELRTGRAHPDHRHDLLERMDEARAGVAAVLGTDVDAITLTHATTDGMDRAVWSIDWRPGDRAVISQLEHPNGTGALHALRDRGIEVDVVDVDGDDERTLTAFRRAIVTGTRLVALPHVSSATGALLPVAAIARLAHERGAVVAVDGAQAAGAIPVDVTAIGADFYAIPAQSWLLGPEGMGAIAVAPGESQHGARRLEGTGFHRPSVVGMARSIGWLQMYVGLEWVHARGTALARRTASRLAAIPGVTVLTPLERMATLVSFRVDGWPSEQALDELGARVFAIARVVPSLDAIRISVGFFNDEAELERFAEAVELLAAHTPETVPPRRRLTILGQG